MTLSQNLNISPFEVFDREMDEIIMLINFYITLGDIAGEEKAPRHTKHPKEERIRVNDKTATNGWF